MRESHRITLSGRRASGMKRGLLRLVVRRKPFTRAGSGRDRAGTRAAPALQLVLATASETRRINSATRGAIFRQRPRRWMK